MQGSWHACDHRSRGFDVSIGKNSVAFNRGCGMGENNFLHLDFIVSSDTVTIVNNEIGLHKYSSDRCTGHTPHSVGT